MRCWTSVVTFYCVAYKACLKYDSGAHNFIYQDGTWVLKYIYPQSVNSTQDENQINRKKKKIELMKQLYKHKNNGIKQKKFNKFITTPYRACLGTPSGWSIHRYLPHRVRILKNQKEKVHFDGSSRTNSVHILQC